MQNCIVTHKSDTASQVCFFPEKTEKYKNYFYGHKETKNKIENQEPPLFISVSTTAVL